jgi:hypothetical protein
MSLNIVTPKNVNNLDDLKIENSVLVPFSNILISFVSDVSKAILKDPFFKEHPELMALAFWMRKSHIKQLHKYFVEQSENKVLLGRGIVFHMAPSNVDTIFVYSWFISLLVGNSNILRISDKENIQTSLLIGIINSVLELELYNILKNRVAIIRYGHEDDITLKLSQMADVRVIWGGDRTVEHIRTIPIKPTATELSFADKFSFAVINSKEIMEEKNLQDLIEKFYNDSFWFGQMACSSVRMVVWVGTKELNLEAQQLFWDKLNQYVLNQQPEEIAPADIVNKLVAECSMAIENHVTISKNENNPFINRVKINNIKEVNENLHCGTGLFYELEIDKFKDLLSSLTKKHQTLAYYGFSKEELKNIIYSSMPNGIDRIVPIGQSLDFSYIWDGYDLFRSFCREVEVL